MVTLGKTKVNVVSAAPIHYHSKLTSVFQVSSQDFMLIFVNLFNKKATCGSKNGTHIMYWYCGTYREQVYKVITTMVIRQLDDPHDVLNLRSPIYDPSVWGTWGSGWAHSVAAHGLVLSPH